MSLYIWGTNKQGQLGTAEKVFSDHLDPQIVESLKGTRVIDAACGEQHTLVVADNGKVFAFGRGHDGCIGNENCRSSKNNEPQCIDTLRPYKIKRVFCGVNHSLALSDEGHVFEWGLLHKNTTSTKAYFGIQISLPGMQSSENTEQPSWVGDIIDKSHKKYYDGALTNTQEYMESNELTNFSAFSSYIQRVPKLVRLDKKIVDVSAGYSFSLCCTDSGEVYGWGFNDKMQLGLGHRYSQEHPQHVKSLGNEIIVKVACGQQHSIVLNQQGECFSWGLGVFGQLGHGRLQDNIWPTKIESLSNVTMISCGLVHSAALNKDGQVFVWGSSEYGQLGNVEGNYMDLHVEKKLGKKQAKPSVLDAFQGRKIVHIACGHLHNVALSEDGLVFSWGWGDGGQLGLGNRRYQLVPQVLSRLIGDPISIVSAGGKHSLGISVGSTTTFAFDFKPLINSVGYSDLEFEVEGKIIYAHKAVVGYRCRYLGAMICFQERFVRNDERTRIKIRGVRYHVFLGLLYYLYTDHLKIPPHVAKDLEHLAIKYGLPRLQQLCHRFWKCQERQYVTQLLQSTSLIPTSSFGSDLLELCASGKFGDVKFLLDDGTVVVAHKALLCSRCEWFGTIFKSNFKENSQSTIKMDSISSDVFRGLLEYLYSADESWIRSERVVEFLVMADRFLLDDLKYKCEDQIEESIDDENCLFLLEVADLHGAPRLRRTCFEYLKRNLPQLLASQPSIAEQISRLAPHLVSTELTARC